MVLSTFNLLKPFDPRFRDHPTLAAPPDLVNGTLTTFEVSTTRKTYSLQYQHLPNYWLMAELVGSVILGAVSGESESDIKAFTGKTGAYPDIKYSCGRCYIPPVRMPRTR